MTQFVSTIVLLTGVLGNIVTSSFVSECQEPRHSRPKPQSYRESKLNPVSPRTPLQEGSKEEIIASCKKLPATVKAEEITVGGVNLLCLSADSGSGKYIVLALVYTKSGDKWKLIYYRAADGKYVDIKFLPKGHDSIQVLGGVASTKNNHFKVTYKVLHTVMAVH